MNFLYVVTILSLFIWTQSKCKSNDNFKYQLNYTSQVQGYHSICSQFSKRTCCSPSNFDNLAKKIQKLIGQSPDLSHNCRRKLSNILCSTCDGDIGQAYFQGICPQICQNVYQQCKHDFFLIDSMMNKMRACKEDDIICSSLNHILDSKQGYKICNLFGIQVSNQNCWKGIPSSMTKGASKKKVQYLKKRPRSAKQQLFKFQTRYFYYIGAVLLLILAALYKWASYKRAQFMRQIKNL